MSTDKDQAVIILAAIGVLIGAVGAVAALAQLDFFEISHANRRAFSVTGSMMNRKYLK